MLNYDISWSWNGQVMLFWFIKMRWKLNIHPILCNVGATSTPVAIVYVCDLLLLPDWSVENRRWPRQDTLNFAFKENENDSTIHAFRIDFRFSWLFLCTTWVILCMHSAELLCRTLAESLDLLTLGEWRKTLKLYRRVRVPDETEVWKIKYFVCIGLW